MCRASAAAETAFRRTSLGDRRLTKTIRFFRFRISIF
jgi:hypothetical protein